MINIVCIGKKHEMIYKSAIEHFEDRLGHFTRVSWALLPHSALSGDEARKDESVRILSKIKPTDFVILLDEKGALATSPELSKVVDRAQYSSQDLCIVIGGAYGVDESILSRSDYTLSFGRVVFPHQLMRVLVLEQMYRAYSILAGGKYHHE